MKIKEMNPDGLADPTQGAEVNPALAACVKTLVEGLMAAGVPDATFVMLVNVPEPKDAAPDAPVTMRIASNMEPGDVKTFLKLVANDGHDVLPMGMAHQMVNLVCRTAKLRELSPADFILLMHKVAHLNVPTTH